MMRLSNGRAHRGRLLRCDAIPLQLTDLRLPCNYDVTFAVFQSVGTWRGREVNEHEKARRELCSAARPRYGKARSLHESVSELASSGTLEHVNVDNVADAFGSVTAIEAVEAVASALSGHLTGAHTLPPSNEHVLVGEDATTSLNHCASTLATSIAPHAAHTAEHSSITNVALATLSTGQDFVSASTGPQSADALHQLGSVLGQQLSTLREVDAESYENVVDAISVLVEAIHEVLHAEAATVVSSAATSLFVSFQHLLDTVQDQASSAASLQMALSATLGEGAGDVGLDGLLKLAVGSVALIIASVPSERAMADAACVDEMPLPTQYDPDELREYFARRPIAVMRRQAQVASNLAAFLAALLADWQAGQLEARMSSRAVWLRNILESLGPAYVKIAQALSTRVDMLPQPYLCEFTKLQDDVPTFASEDARAIVEADLGAPLDSVFAEFSSRPIASASLGQVYRARLRERYGGVEVAVKVQRPGIMESVALDTLLMRKMTEVVSSIPQFSTGWSEVLDDWAARFFQEMDYTHEAHNMIAFKRDMADLDAVVVPDVFPEFTSRRVITSRWIDGTKLSECDTDDVLRLCDALLNCYLIQLLETGFLHADPHPGNLLRTPDGKLCILDFGLMAEVDAEQRINLVEYIAHLSLEDWDGVCTDLVALGFLPPSTSTEELEVMTPLIKQVMGQLVVRGTGGVSMGGLSLQLEGVARRYKMVIPPYFALVLRSFSVIEGIAMQHDASYRIVGSCFPYLSRRLLTDRHPRMRRALRDLLYGSSDRLDVNRLMHLMESFSAFTVGPTAGQHASFASDAAKLAMVPHEERVVGADDEPSGAGGVDDRMKDVLRVVFSEEGSYPQELIVEELVASVDALSREAVSEALKLVLASEAAVSALRNMEALGPVRAMILPMPLPMATLTSMGNRVKLTANDRRALDTISVLLALMGGAPGGRHRHSAVGSFGLDSLLTGADSTLRASTRFVQGARDLLPMVPEVLPGMQKTFEMFITRLVRRMALRLAEDLAPASE